MNAMNPIPKRFAAALAMVPLAVGLSTQAAVLVFDADADAMIRNTGGGPQNTNYGNEGYVSIYTDLPSNVQRTLLRFDVSSIPVGSTINSATLTLTAVNADPLLGINGNPSGLAMEIFRVFQPWNETQVTWNQRQTGVNWSSGGSDHVGQGAAVPPASPYATDSTVIADGYAGNPTISWDITTLVDEWVNNVGEGNNGLVIRSYELNRLHFFSKEGSGDGPSLEVNFTPIPEPMHLGILSAVGLFGLAAYRRFRHHRSSAPIAG